MFQKSEKVPTGSVDIMKKERRQSRFSVSTNEELEMLPPLRGKRDYSYIVFMLPENNNYNECISK